MFQTGSIIPFVLLIVAFIAMFYFVLIRPIRQREKRHDTMVDELEKGDMVITAGGIFGQVESIDEDSLVLRVESGALIRVTKGGVVSRRDVDLLGQ